MPKKILMILKRQFFKTSIITCQKIIGPHYLTSQKLFNIFMTNSSDQLKPQLKVLNHFILKITKVRNIHLKLKKY